MKKSEINAKEFAKMIDKATNFLKKIEESDDIFELDLDSIKKETDKLTKELEEKYKDHLDSEK
jgi:3-dehydroquinate dehydratase|tara:strand:- start:93 stop:281 length:189 start_codon:yes stop_codon:yes gene_type:complete